MYHIKKNNITIHQSPSWNDALDWINRRVDAIELQMILVA
jgi:hypothetical protein